MDFTIRPASPQDGAELSALIRGLDMFGGVRAEDPGTTAERVGRHLDMTLADESHAMLVAVGERGRLLGYAAVHWLPFLFLTGPEGHLSELFVVWDARGEGVGTALLDAVVQRARERGCARLRLGAVRSRESYRRGFYTERGWVERTDMADMVYDLGDSR